MSEHECGCPSWVIACCHVAGQMRLRVIDVDASEVALNQVEMHFRPFSQKWALVKGPLLRCTGIFCSAMHVSPQPSMAFEAHDEALSAFHLEEARIRREVFGR